MANEKVIMSSIYCTLALTGISGLIYTVLLVQVLRKHRKNNFRVIAMISIMALAELSYFFYIVQSLRTDFSIGIVATFAIAINNGAIIFIDWLICETYMTVSIDANFIAHAVTNKSFKFDLKPVEKQKKCLMYMNWLNGAAALAFTTLLIIGYWNTSSAKPWVFRLWTFDSILSATYLVIWICTLVFLYIRVSRKMKFLPKKRMFILHGLLIFLTNITGYATIILFSVE